jgi:hypothetical protein
MSVRRAMIGHDQVMGAGPVPLTEEAAGVGAALGCLEPGTRIGRLQAMTEVTGALGLFR